MVLFGRNINKLEVRHLMDLQFSPSQHLNSQKSTNMTKTLSLGGQQVPVPGFGAMGLNSAMGSDLNLEQSEPVLLKAIELGCTFWDTAVSRSLRIVPSAIVLTFANPRLPTKTVKMRSFLETSLRSTTFATRFSVSNLFFTFVYIVSLAHVAQWPPSVDLTSLGLNAR